MKISFELVNGKKLLKEIEKRRTAAGKAAERRLKIEGLMVQRESQRIVPVDLGNLKASAVTRAEGSGLNTIVIVGYTAAYALYVHEIEEAAHGTEFNLKHADEIAAGKEHRRGPNQVYKFLEIPFRERRPIIREKLKEDLRNALRG